MSVTNFFARKWINYDSQKSLAFKLRKKRSKRIISLIEEVYKQKKEVKIIDIGGTRTYWNIFLLDFLKEKKVKITLINLAEKEKHFEEDEVFTFVEGNGVCLDGISNNEFDIAHSNSVIEHLGNWKNMLDFSKEIKRVAKIYYIQTPNYYFPIEPHFMFPFFHYLSIKNRIRLLMRFRLGWFPKAKTKEEAMRYVEECQLLTKKKMEYLFPNSDFYKEKIFFMTKSIIAIKKKY